MIEAIVSGLQHTSPAERLSVALGLLYSILAAKRLRWCWVAGALSSAIAMVVQWNAQLPMQGILQAYYVGIAVYGFWHWSRDQGKAKPDVTSWPLRAHIVAAAGILLLSAVSSRFVATYMQSAWPYLDSVTMWGSLLATWLTAQVKLENWLYWIVFNAISVFLFVKQDLMLFALLGAVYVVISAFGFVAWLRSRRVLAPTG